MGLGDYIRLLRPAQWYKNLLVFLPLIFALRLGNTMAVWHSIIAFISFCALSSTTYIINDYADRNIDKLNPEKANRPIASGAVGPIEALTLVLLLTAVGFGTAIVLPLPFLYTALGYFALSQIYTAWLKHETFADILAISINFVIRAVAGAFAIPVNVSPWLIAGIFFLALFLTLGKRRSELMLLKDKAFAQRPALAGYSPDVVSRLSALATTALVISYTLYVFFGEHKWLYVTLPIALYCIFRYETIISSGSKISRHPERVFTDARMVIAMIIWVGLTLAVLY